MLVLILILCVCVCPCVAVCLQQTMLCGREQGICKRSGRLWHDESHVIPNNSGTVRHFRSHRHDTDAGSQQIFSIYSKASLCPCLTIFRWLLYDERGFCGNQFVLEEGLYPDLTAVGCMATAIKSFKPIHYVSP